MQLTKEELVRQLSADPKPHKVRIVYTSAPDLLAAAKPSHKGRTLLVTQTFTGVISYPPDALRRILEESGKDPSVIPDGPTTRRWGQRVENSAVVYHNGKNYLSVNNVEVEAGSQQYFYGDDESQLDANIIKPQLKPSSSSIFRDFKFDGISAIEIDDTHAMVVKDFSPQKLAAT